MRHPIFLIFIFIAFNAFTQKGYQSLDQSDPILFGGDFIIYQNDTIALGPHSFFIDGNLSNETANGYPFVFNSIQSATAKLTNGSEAEPMTIHVAPWVYWIDNPDDLEERTPTPGYNTPYGMVIKCEWLKFHGLNKDPKNIVLACNRGQTIGSQGNFTMFRFEGDGTSAENITFGNFCNVDLEFPLKPELSREKRASAIVQAQLILCDGDKVFAQNCRFISRLNLCPFVGSKRTLFENCHFESTDDALNGSAVYLNSTFDFHSSKPFYHTRGTGAVFLNCNIQALTHSKQHFTKANGQLAVVDTRFYGHDDLYISWNDVMPAHTRNYQYNVTLNDRPIFIGYQDSANTVDMTNQTLLDAYRFEYNGDVIYNTYNLLKGNDDWDPMRIKPVVLEAEKNLGKQLTDLPVQLKLNIREKELETEKDTAALDFRLYRFGNFEAQKGNASIEFLENGANYLSLVLKPGGVNPIFIPKNNGINSEKVIIEATSKSGLKAAHQFTINPKIQKAPELVSAPKLKLNSEGSLMIKYQLSTKFEDQSIISWYRCTDKKGGNPIEVATSKLNQPLRAYQLSPGDVGYFIKASIQPKHLVSEVGPPMEIIYKKAIKQKDVIGDPKIIHPNFQQLSTKNQEQVLPGFWTFRHLKNPDRPVSGDAWWYGEGQDGAANIWGLTQGRSGFMAYTPIQKKSGDMSFKIDIAPFKSAGQGFSVAPLHMDLLIKFDAALMTGYGLRIMRTTKYGNAVDFVFVKYENGRITEISDPISTSCYRTICSISLSIEGNQMIANASTDSEFNLNGYESEVWPEIDMSTNVDDSDLGGFGIFYNGGASAVITDLEVKWE